MITISRSDVAHMLAALTVQQIALAAAGGSLPARTALRMIADGKALGYGWAARAFAEAEVATWEPLCPAAEGAVMV